MKIVVPVINAKSDKSGMTLLTSSLDRAVAALLNRKFQTSQISH